MRTPLAPHRNPTISTAETRSASLPRYDHWNTSLRFAPTPEVMRRSVEAYGKARVIRVFITLDEFWDYRDGLFHHDFRIGHNRYTAEDVIHPYDRDRTRPSDVSFLDYLDACSASADELLLCFRRYEHERRDGVISRRQYQQVLHEAFTFIKKRCPNLRYIECCNEWRCSHFGGLTDEEYFDLFCDAAEVVSSVNEELRLPPDQRLAIGGSAEDKKHFAAVEGFVRRIGASDGPRQAFGFLSFHDYLSGDNPDRLGELGRRARSWLQASGFGDDVPIWATEVGVSEGAKDRLGNLRMAAGVPLLLDATSGAPNFHAFPWCTIHDPQIQAWSTMMTPNGELTPHGLSMSLLNQHHDRRLSVDVATLPPGVRALASRNPATGACLVQFINYSPERATAPLGAVDAPADVEWASLRIDAESRGTLDDLIRPSGSVDPNLVELGPFEIVALMGR